MTGYDAARMAASLLFVISPALIILFLEVIDSIEDKNETRKSKVRFLEELISENLENHPCDSCNKSEDEVENLGCEFVCSWYDFVAQKDEKVKNLRAELKELNK